MKKTLIAVLLGVFLLQAGAAALSGMPAFGRKYSLSCKTCHAPFPRLKPYGEEFAGEGFVIKDKESPRYFQDTGDSLLSLLRDIPLALRLDGFLSFNNAGTGRFDFNAPYILKVLSGGELFKNVAYYFYFFFSERGEVAGIEDAFVMFNNVLRTGLDITLGQFQISDPLFKRELRLTLEDYQVYRARPGLSGINLTYDRGLMLNFSLPTSTDLTVEVLNGSGIGPADADRNFDHDAFKNFAFHISQNLGAKIRLGGFAFLGRERLGDFRNTVRMFGLDATVASPPFEFNFQYLERRDDDPYFVGAVDDSLSTRGALAELIYLPRGDDSRWYGVGLVNWVVSDSEELDYFSFTGGGGYLLRRNMRLVAEVTYYDQSPWGRYFRLAAGLVTAF
ncbi:MAG: hypothetical protein A2Y86_06440 [Candidatus Aminicenantes bacterium RBG_13_62_12]|nr:MAG: hypothetical protein A2Y86_06440 [Candidatus Aminicenantes bacterium RBG_13_62_12]